MSNAVFPQLAGIGWSVKRTPMWQTRVQTSVSGKETRSSDWIYPKYKWSLTYDLLRDDAINDELQTLMGFYLLRQGQFDSFLYQDQDDNSVTNQVFALGDGVSTVFQLVRAYGGFTEQILAPNVISAVMLNGVPTSSYTLSANGIITFATAPGSGVIGTVNFSYYFPCRFITDTLEFEQFMSKLWSIKALEFMSIR